MTYVKAPKEIIAIKSSITTNFDFLCLKGFSMIYNDKILKTKVMLNMM